MVVEVVAVVVVVVVRGRRGVDDCMNQVLQMVGRSDVVRG